MRARGLATYRAVACAGCQSNYYMLVGWCEGRLQLWRGVMIAECCPGYEVAWFSGSSTLLGASARRRMGAQTPLSNNIAAWLEPPGQAGPGSLHALADCSWITGVSLLDLPCLQCQQ